MGKRIPPEWICRKCNQLKPSSAFTKEHTICKQCYAPDPFKKRVKNLLRKYNLTLERYHEMLHNQGGVCASCKQEETLFDIRINAIRPLCVDHDHKTGQVRGLLCHNCNVLLGMLETKSELFESLKLYLSECEQKI